MKDRAYQEAWDVARARFGDRFSFFAPSLRIYQTEEFKQSCDCYFTPVSITGSTCKLMCDHCGGRILKFMKAAKSPGELVKVAEDTASRGGRGLLVSGGSDISGIVPLNDFEEAMLEIRQRLDMKVIVHTSMTDDELAASLARAEIEIAMIDVIGSERTIKDVCHLEDIGIDDYESSLTNLEEAGVEISPHVVIGLDHGRVDGEFRAIDMISEHDIKSLVLVGLLPLPGTPMKDIKPADPETMGEIFLYARKQIPDKPVLLGCERPAGDHRRMTDELAIRAGLNGIAFPAEGSIAYAERLGLRVEKSEQCCALAECTTCGAS